MSICAVMTLYHPDSILLEENIRVLTNLGIFTMLYDNTPSGAEVEDGDRLKAMAAGGELLCSYLGFGENHGLAVAYNTCIKSRIDSDVEAFLILDQDTDLKSSELVSLLASYHELKALCDLGVLGGKPLRADGAAYRYKSSRLKKNLPGYFDALLVISSFSLIPKSAFLKVGFFQEDFFIDHIDYDFCWQCHKHGLATLIHEESTFVHIVGKGDVRLFGKIICPISAPFRGYYQVRNTLLSSSRGGAPVLWTIKELIKRFIVVSLNGIYDGNLIKRWAFAFRGLIHGISGVGGKYPE